MTRKIFNRLDDAPAPLPKVNVPPRLRTAPPAEPPFSPADWPRVSDRALFDEPAPVIRRGIRWNLRFTLSLIFLLLVSNAMLALALGNARRSLMAARDDAGILPALVPAAGTPFSGAPAATERKRGVTIYAPSDDRQSVIDHLDHLPPPGIVSVTPSAASPTHP